MKRFHVTLRESEREEIRQAAFQLDISMAEVMRRGFELLKQQLQEEEKGNEQ